MLSQEELYNTSIVVQPTRMHRGVVQEAGGSRSANNERISFEL